MQVTEIVGGDTCGYCAIGNVPIAMLPASVITIDSTAAKIGRSMKNREITARSSQLKKSQGNCFVTVMSDRLIAVGKIGKARVTRFWTSSRAMSMSIPRPNERVKE